MTDQTGRSVVVDAARDPLWGQLVAKRGTSVFQSQPWIAVLSQSYPFPIRAQVLLDGTERPVAGVAYAEVDDVQGARLVSLPFSDFCDPILTADEHWPVLVESLLEQRRPLHMKCLHSTVALSDPLFHTVGRARWHGVDLNRTEEAIWEGLHSSARRAVRKATTDGVEVKVARDRADLRAFFELHLRVRKRKYGLLAQPFGFFERIWEHFLDGHRGALLLGELEGRVVSGVLFLEWQDTLYYKFNASDDAFLASRPNDRVLWEGIRYGCERGLSALDFGLTDWDHEGLIRYKRKYATEERIITAIQHDGDEQQGAARGRQARQLVRQVAGLLADESVPDEVSERAGDLLYRYFT